MKNKNPKNAGRKPDSLLGPRVRLVHKALPEHVDFFNNHNVKRSEVIDSLINDYMQNHERKIVFPPVSNTQIEAAVENLKFEVRIGNWLKYKKPDEVDYECTRITRSAFENDWIDMTYEPEPLCLYWVERFGFKKTLGADPFHNGTLYYSIELSEFRFCGLFIYRADKKGGIEARVDPMSYAPSFRVKFVHQLQNVFYDMTGVELLFRHTAERHKLNQK